MQYYIENLPQGMSSQTIKTVSGVTLSQHLIAVQASFVYQKSWNASKTTQTLL